MNETINNESVPAPARSTVLFDRFWEAYPRHEAKKDALKAFEKINPDEGLLQRMLEAVAGWKGTDQWQENGGQFIPYPATWLNGRRWEDDIPKPREKAQKQVIAQQYGQRDYSGVPDEIRERQSRKVEEFLRQKQEAQAARQEEEQQDSFCIDADVRERQNRKMEEFLRWKKQQQEEGRA